MSGNPATKILHRLFAVFIGLCLLALPPAAARTAYGQGTDIADAPSQTAEDYDLGDGLMQFGTNNERIEILASQSEDGQSEVVEHWIGLQKWGDEPDIPEHLLLSKAPPNTYNWKTGKDGGWVGTVVLHGAKWRQDNGKNVISVSEDPSKDELYLSPIGFGSSQFTFYVLDSSGQETGIETHVFRVEQDPVALDRVYRMKLGGESKVLDFPSMVNSSLNVEVSDLAVVSCDPSTGNTLSRNAVNVKISPDKSTITMDPVEKGLSIVSFYLAGTAKDSSVESSGKVLYIFHVLVDDGDMGYKPDDNPASKPGTDSGDTNQGESSDGGGKIRHNLKDLSDTGIKVDAQLGGANVRSGAEVTIEIRPVEVPAAISSKMSHAAIGAYAIDMFVKNPGDERAVQVHDGFGSVSLSFPTGNGYSANNVRLHHLHESSNAANYAEYGFTTSGLASVCRVDLDDKGNVESVTTTTDCGSSFMAATLEKVLKKDPSFSQCKISRPSSTLLSWSMSFGGTSTLAEVRDTVLAKQTGFHVISEPSGDRSGVSTQDIKVVEGYASTTVTNLSVFALESMSDAGSLGSGPVGATPSSTTVGASLVQTGDGNLAVIISLGILGMLSLAFVVSFTIMRLIRRCEGAR